MALLTAFSQRAPLIFVALVLKDLAGSAVFNLFFNKPCIAFPLPQSPRYEPKDASVVLAVVDPPESFTWTLKDWALQRPLEIILVTTPKWKSLVERHAQDAVKDIAIHPPIRVLVCEIPSHREQQVMGYRAARGSVILRSDDDVFWHHPKAISYLLAPFGSIASGSSSTGKERLRAKEKVGGVVGMHMPAIPPTSASGTPMTPWQAISLKTLEDIIATQKTCFAADSGVICLIGRTVAIRADIIQTEEFYRYFLNERWVFTNRVHAGDDTAITRWVQARSRTVYQCAPEAALTTLTNSEYGDWIGQVTRWWRSRSMHFIKLLWGPPCLPSRLAAHPYTTFQLLNTLSSVPLVVLYSASWVITFRNLLLSTVLREGLEIGAQDQRRVEILLGIFALFHGLARVYAIAHWSVSLGQRFHLSWHGIVKLMAWRFVGMFLLEIWTWMTVWVDRWGGRTDASGTTKID